MMTPQLAVTMYIDAAAHCRRVPEKAKDDTSYVNAHWLNAVDALREQSKTAYGAILAANFEDFCRENALKIDHPDVLDARDILSGKIEWPERIEEKE